MSLDGATIHLLKKEILLSAQGGRVDRIAQPSRDEIIIHLRCPKGNKKLLISASANNPRIHFTQFPPENPSSPPMFCMLLRKHLQGAKLIDINQEGLDRVLYLRFETYNDLGDKVILTLSVEIMGRHSNIILLDENKKIIDAIHRIDFNLSQVRQILPGMLYIIPPIQDKHNILTTTFEVLVSNLSNHQFEYPLSKALMNTLQGFSLLPCREISYQVTGGNDSLMEELSNAEILHLGKIILDVKNILNNSLGTPTIVMEKSGKPKDFSFMPVSQYGTSMETVEYNDFSTMLDVFYTKRDTIDRIHQRSGDLLRHVENQYHRTVKKVAVQKEELLSSQNREELRVKGDLITANIHLLDKGMSVANLPNYYDPNYKEIQIPLDIRKTPARNAQHYYLQYKKADTAEKKLTELIKSGEQDIVYLESVIDNLKRAETEYDIEAIRQELKETGYLRRTTSKKQKNNIKQPPATFVSTDGFLIRTGRNNIQNDKLTLKESKGEDLWLHTQKLPGSHTVIITEGKEVPDQTLLEAAMIAAYHSTAQNSSKVAVDYTYIRNVKKASGAKPGMVIYENFKTILVNPNEQIINSLKQKNN